MFWRFASQNSQINTRSSHPQVFCQRMFLKILLNHRKTSLQESFFKKRTLETWNCQKQRLEMLRKKWFSKKGFFFYLGFLSRTFTNHRAAGEGEGISLPPHYFHTLHRHLDISRVITAESSPLHIASSSTRVGNLWLQSASR